MTEPEQDMFKTMLKNMEKMQKHIEQVEDENRYLKEQLAAMRKQLYGRRSEKTSVIFDAENEQLSLFNEVETDSKPSTPEPEVEPATEVKAHRRRKSKGHQEELLKILEHEKIVCDIPDDEQNCDRCHGKLTVLGEEKLIRSEIKKIPARLVVVDYYQKTYQCEACRKDEHFSVKKGTVPKAVLPHSIASPSAIASVIHQKYALGVPLYRQEQEWRELGLGLSRATMANWLIGVHKYYLAFLVGRLRELLLQEEVLHADETVLQVLNEKNRKNTTKSYLWLYCSSVFEPKHKIRFFDYQPGRSGSFAKEFLKGFSGYLVHDQYAGYNKVENVTDGFCWAHLRRYFTESLPEGTKDKESSLAGQAIRRINELFALEAEFKDLTAQERYARRLERERPLAEAFFEWVEKTYPVVPARSKLGRALSYALNGRKGYMTYLNDGRINFTNSTAENAIRPAVIGRKNYLFCASPKGADATAAIYTLVETCKANDILPDKYFEYILSRMPNEPLQNKPELIDKYLPWSEMVQKNCR